MLIGLLLLTLAAKAFSTSEIQLCRLYHDFERMITLKNDTFDNVRAKAVRISGPRDARCVENFPTERALNTEGNTSYSRIYYV